MLGNYAKVAMRNLLKYKTYSAINIFGMSIAVACCISVFLFLQTYWTLDNFHMNGDRIFMVEYVTETNGETQVWGDVPPPIAAALATDFPQVERAIRIQREGVKLFNKENVFDEVLTYADTGFFQMFTFPLQWGDPAALADPSAIILSADMAKKYFRDTMPIGRNLMLVSDSQERRQFVVQGVAEPFPKNTGFAFDLLTGYHPVHPMLKTQDWKSRTEGVFVQLRQPQDAATLVPQMQRYVAPFNANNPEAPLKSFVLDNLRHPTAKAYDVLRRPAEAHHPAVTLIFSLIALTMIALSCFNYVNISLGGVSRRLKEIGIRKVLGGQREQLIAQFMAENLLLCFIALMFGLLLTESFFVPLLNDVMVLQTEISFADNKSLWLMLAGLLAITALVSGAYPALFFRAHEADFGYLLVRFARGSGKRVAAQLENNWLRLFPGTPVNHFFQNEIFDGFYRSFRNVSKSFGYVAGLALVIACMGLYGLAAQHFSRRLKEVGVRKMLGATVAQILLLVNREFVIMLLVAGMLATALSFLGMLILLRNMEQFIGNYQPGMGPFLLANLLVLFTAATAVGRQSWNVTKLNLSEVLKNNE